MALAGLAGGVIDAASTVTCTQVYNYYVSEYGAAAFTPTCLGYHGVETVVDALRVSCNIFFYDVGRRVGIDAIEQSAISLGLGQDNGFELWDQPRHHLHSLPPPRLPVRAGTTAMCSSPPSGSGLTAIPRFSWRLTR